VFSVILLLVGASFLLLLNGQHFTNRLMLLAFVSASGLLWARYRYRLLARANDADGVDVAGAGRFALVVHLILLIALAATLPSTYASQNEFNEGLKRIKTRIQIPRP
jgi:hypothetical protein